MDVKIIKFLGVQGTCQKSVVALMRINDLENYFRLGPDLSWKFKQHLHSFCRHSASSWCPQIPHSQLGMVTIIPFRI